MYFHAFSVDLDALKGHNRLLMLPLKISLDLAKNTQVSSLRKVSVTKWLLERFQILHFRPFTNLAIYQ